MDEYTLLKESIVSSEDCGPDGLGADRAKEVGGLRRS
jgi:hypothetical protein